MKMKILHTILLLTIIPFLFGGIFFVGVSFNQTPEFQIAKTKYLIWGLSSLIVVGSILWCMLWKPLKAVKMGLVIIPIALLMLSASLWNQCPDLKKELSLPSELQNAQIKWDKKINSYEVSDAVDGCALTGDARKKLREDLGPSPYADDQGTPISADTVFTIQNYYQYQPFFESGDGFFGRQPRRYLKLLDQNGEAYLVETSWLKDVREIGEKNLGEFKL